MNKERRLLDECSQFLTSVRPEETPAELVKPFPESTLHESTIDELRAKLYEARSFQHTYPQFSEAEAKHFQFVDEATAVLEFKQLEELNKTTLRSYTIKAAGDMNRQGLEQGHRNTIQYMDKPENAQEHRNKALDAQKKTAKRFDGILKATRRLATESEQLDELSNKTLKDYREKASEKVGEYKYGSKAPTMNIGTVNKRVKGFVKAGSKLSDRIKNANTLIKANEEVEHIDEGISHAKSALQHSALSDKLNNQYSDGADRTFKVAADKHEFAAEKHRLAARQKAISPYGYKTHAEDYVKKAKSAKEASEMAHRFSSTLKHTVAESKESLDEERGPLKGHPYHSKSDAELHYIVKDAGEAAQAMKNHNPKAESKYLDQVNDASTVLHYRKNGGARVVKESEVTEGYMKTIKRHFQGWNDTAEKPKDIKARVSSMSDASIAASKQTRTKMEPEPHTPEATQRKLVDREFKKRTQLKEGFDRTGSLNRIKNLLG